MAAVRQYIVRRLLMMVPVLLIISVIEFSFLYLLPGDPAVAILGPDLAGDKHLYNQLRQQLGLNDPIYVQYGRWLIQVVQGNLGTSVQTREPVTQMVLLRLPVTAELSALALLFGIVIGISVAMMSAFRPNTLLDVVASFFALGGIAMPAFWLGILLIFAFSIALHWLPPTGYIAPGKDLWLNLRLMIMPALTIGAGLAGVIMRQSRAALLEVLDEDYIRTARAKGLGERLIIYRHALRNALIPVATVIGLQFGTLLGGAVITESIFAIPGLGQMTINAIFLRDYPTVQGGVLITAIAVVAANFLTDIVYAYLDPRIHYA